MSGAEAVTNHVAGRPAYDRVGQTVRSQPRAIVGIRDCTAGVRRDREEEQSETEQPEYTEFAAFHDVTSVVPREACAQQRLGE